MKSREETEAILKAEVGFNDIHYVPSQACWDLAVDYRMKTDVAVEEIERLEKWIGDLQSGMYINCVYCGHRYGPADTTPVSMADILKEHIEQCSQHPMSALKEENVQLRKELSDAAREINCAGTVAHRIQVLKKEHSETVKELLELLGQTVQHFVLTGHKTLVDRIYKALGREPLETTRKV